MIDEHIKSMEFGSDSINATCDFNNFFLNKNFLWIEMFKMNDIMVKKHKVSIKLSNDLLALKKTLPNF
jgi:hypothetical protein